MAEDKIKHPAFTGEKPGAINHLNPPKPKTDGKSEPVKPDHFARIEPKPLSAAVPKPAAK